MDSGQFEALIFDTGILQSGEAKRTQRRATDIFHAAPETPGHDTGMRKKDSLSG